MKNLTEPFLTGLWNVRSRSAKWKLREILEQLSDRSIDIAIRAESRMESGHEELDDSQIINLGFKFNGRATRGLPSWPEEI